jgi:hypothetical protein
MLLSSSLYRHENKHEINMLEEILEQSGCVAWIVLDRFYVFVFQGIVFFE